MPKEEETKKEENQPNKAEAARPVQADPKDVEQNKAVTFLSYIGILALVPLLAAKESKFAQFHAKQGLVLAVIFFVIPWILWYIPFVYWFMIILWPIAIIIELVLSIIGLLNVAKGEMKELPVIGEIVKKINI